MSRLDFAIPGDLDTPTGGYGYNRRLIAGLGDLGWEVRQVHLPAGFPRPTPDDLAAAAAAFAAIPTNALVLVDGLAYGAMPEVAAREAGRLRLVALVHHPLGDESGLTPIERERLLASEGASLAQARTVICTSFATADRVRELFGLPEAPAVAAPGTDPAARAPASGDPPVILSIGSLIERKRHDVLIAALAQIGDRPWTARIVGSDRLDPGCAAALRRQIAASGLNERITLVGPLTDTRAELAKADIFALASEYEGYGMAFAEALSHGLPVVACGVGAIGALVPAAAGGLVPPGDADAFAAAIASLLDDRARRRACADAAWAAGRRLPTWRETVERVAGVLERVAT
jgi:glycosyltransferase involved in cell wall biosynthesis